MGYKHYLISDAAKKLDVEPHVLRYWEDELELGILRNDMGHRYYREEDISVMGGVKFLKEKGFQLKSIKILLPEMDKVLKLDTRRLLELRDRLEIAVSQEELRRQREEELTRYPAACGQNKEEKKETAEGDEGEQPASVETGIRKKEGTELSSAERMQQFKNIMNEIIMEAMQENNQKLTCSITDSVSREFEYQMRRKEMLAEEHFKQLDRTLRECQQGQKQAAVARECGTGRKKSKFFRKNRRDRMI